jgi:hypothetical protein
MPEREVRVHSQNAGRQEKRWLRIRISFFKGDFLATDEMSNRDSKQNQSLSYPVLTLVDHF